MEDFVILTKKQIEYLYHKLNYGWTDTFEDYLGKSGIDPDRYKSNGDDVGYDTWCIINDLLESLGNVDPDEVVAGFLIKRKVR